MPPNCSAAPAASTGSCIPTTTSTWGSRRTTCSRRRRALRCCSGIGGLVESARALAASIARQGRAPSTSVLKVGRTHLQDAVPMTLGQEFGGYAACVAARSRRGRARGRAARGAESRGHRRRHGPQCRRGVRDAGHPEPEPVHRAARSSRAANRFRVTQSMGDVLAYSGAMRRLAVELGKIASDLRLLSMGPRAGIAEIILPAVQPGSSIMPGKVNPSMPEMVNQVCYQVIGCDVTICTACEAGQLELNVMMPVIAWNALHILDDPARVDEGAAHAVRGRHRSGRRAMPRAARSQHRGRHGAQSLHRLRRDRRDREGVGEDRPPFARSSSSAG